MQGVDTLGVRKTVRVLGESTRTSVYFFKSLTNV